MREKLKKLKAFGLEIVEHCLNQCQQLPISEFLIIIRKITIVVTYLCLGFLFFLQLKSFVNVTVAEIHD